MHTEVFHGIETVDQTLWDSITTGHPFASWAWCRYGEIVLRAKGYYLVVYDAGEPVGGAELFVMNDENIPTSNRLVQRALRFYLQRRPLIVCRTAPVTDHRGFFLPGDTALRERVLAELRHHATAITHQNNGSFFLADYIFEHELNYPWGDMLTIRDFTNIGMALHVEWDTWDAFMAALKQQNKKAHKNVRHNLRYAEEAGVTVQVSREAPPPDDVERLILTKMDHYDVAFDPADARDIMRGFAVLPPGYVTWISAFHEGCMVGTEALLHDPANRICKPSLYGRDYTVDYVYFAMSYEDIRYAIEDLRVKTIIYDTEAYDFKRRLGMVQDPRNNLVLRPSSPIERGLTSVLMRFMND